MTLGEPLSASASKSELASRRGWSLLLLASTLYGLGISPGYYGFGLCAPGMAADFRLSRADVGLAFSIFVFGYSAAGLAVGWLARKLSLRALIASGAALAALGYVCASLARGFGALLAGYGLVAGIGVGLSTIVPCQTLAIRWFERYRSTALGIILAAGGVVGMTVLKTGDHLLEHADWRTFWRVTAAISAAVAVAAALWVRDEPEAPATRDPAGAAGAPAASDGPLAGARGHEPAARLRDVLNYRFLVMALCSAGYAGPYAVAVSHGVLHLADLGHAQSVAASAVGAMALLSIAGRLGASLGDLMSPRALLACALLLEGGGVLLFVAPESESAVYASLALLSIGFGLAYTGTSVVTSVLFEPRLFAAVSGGRYLVTGVASALASYLAGLDHDRTESYRFSMIALALVAALAAVLVAVCRPPRAAASGERAPL